MVCVVARGIVSLGPEALDIRLFGPALECKGAGFDALDDVVPVDERFL